VAVFALSPDARTLAAAWGDGSVRIWDIAAGAMQQESNAGGPQPISCNFSPDGNRLVLGLRDHTVRVVNLDQPAEPMILAGHTDELQDACFSSDGRSILSAGVDGAARLWDAQSGASLGILHWPANQASICSCSAVTMAVATGSHRHGIKLWNGSTGQPARTLSGHTGAVLACRFTPSGTLISSSADGTLRVWDPVAGAGLLILEGHDGPVQAFDCSPGGSRIVSGGNDRRLRVWDARTGELLVLLSGHEHWVTLTRFIAGGNRILSGSADRTARIWDPASRRLLQTLDAHKAPVSAAAEQRGRARVVTGDELGVLHIWNIESGTLEGTLSGHTGAIRACGWPDGIVSASQDGTVRIWDPETFATRFELKHDDPVQACAVSPDRRLVASGSEDQFVRIWDLSTGRRLGEYWAGATVTSLCWEANGTRLAAGIATGRLHLLDWEEASTAGISASAALR
jgi:WD40 repeat protein